MDANFDFLGSETPRLLSLLRAGSDEDVERNTIQEMMFEVLEEEADAATEPQVTSRDPLERKLARRLRIQKRVEAMRKQRNAEEGDEGSEEIAKSILEQQIIDSMLSLDKIMQDGQEQVTNVRVANDAREIKRRQEQTDARKARTKLLDKEARESMKLFEKINEKWEEIAKSNDPLDIYNEMEKQKEKCLELLSKKNEIIDELQKEVERNDERFSRDMRKQKEDLNILAERIDNHISIMHRAYRQELNLLEEAITIEQTELMENANKDWEELHKDRDMLEVNNMKTKFELVDDYEKELDAVHIEHQEKFREAKISLEGDIHVIQQELERVKAVCLLNTEKLDYNFQVLKKRDDENIIMKAQQKRRINKLQDVVNDLREKIEEAERTTCMETQRLTEEVTRLHGNIMEIEQKADHFAKVNDHRYHEVWEMNRVIAQELLDKILAADKLIHEQQLGLEWEPPELELIDKKDLPSFRTAMQTVTDLFKPKSHHTNPLPPIVTNDLDNIRNQENLMRHIMQRLADNTGFLLEERIFGLLFPHRRVEKTLVKLDQIFNTLGIYTEADVITMREYFLPYTACAQCGYSPSRDASIAESIAGDEDAGAEGEETKSDRGSSEDGAESRFEEFKAEMKILEADAEEEVEEEEKKSKEEEEEEEEVEEEEEESEEESEESDELEEEGEKSVKRPSVRKVKAISTVAPKTITIAPGVILPAGMMPEAGLLLPPGVKPPASAKVRGKIDITEPDTESILSSGGEERQGHGSSEGLAGPPHYITKEEWLQARQTCLKEHTLTIDPIYIVRALREFVAEFSKKKAIIIENMTTKLNKNRNTVSRLLQQDDVATYWNRYCEVFGPEREKLWDTLFMGLQKYHQILVERHKLNEEVKALSKQNEELRQILQQYMICFGKDNKRRGLNSVNQNHRRPTRFPPI